MGSSGSTEKASLSIWMLLLLLRWSKLISAASIVIDDGAARYNESRDTGWTDEHFRAFLNTSRLNRGTWHDCIRFQGDRPISMELTFTGVLISYANSKCRSSLSLQEPAYQ
jgi:hypothetical protein